MTYLLCNLLYKNIILICIPREHVLIPSENRLGLIAK